MLTKSKYCRGFQCPKILWLDKHMPEQARDAASDAVLENGIRVGEAARDYFGGCALVEYSEDWEMMVARTKELLEEGAPVIAEASFAFAGNFCSVDLLKVDPDGVTIIEVKSGTHLEEIYVEDMAYQFYVLSNCGLGIKGVYCMYLNSGYVRQGALDLRQLFVLKNCMGDVLARQEGVEERIDQLEIWQDRPDEPEMELDLYCEKPYECAYKDYCKRLLPKPNVFDIHGMQNKKKYQLYYQGIVSFQDILERKPKLNEKQLRQVETEVLHKPPEIDRQGISRFLQTLSYPLYFLDFETFQQAIPAFDGVSPYMQIPFQYSLHVIRNEGAPLEHFEFLGREGPDPRRALAEQLCREIPRGVCTLAYNMSFEKSVIAKLADQFPDLKEHLMDIHGNIKDLMIPFKEQRYYSRALQGSYSIKWVLPALCPGDPELDYHALDGIHNGSEAMTAFAGLSSRTPAEIAEIRQSLLAYCRLDTLAMVKIWEKLRELAEEA